MAVQCGTTSLEKYVQGPSESPGSAANDGDRMSSEDCATCATPVASEMISDCNDQSSSVVRVTYPKVCRNREQFEAWQRTRKWLIFDCSCSSVKCTSCSQVKRLGLHTAPGQHNETAFVDGSVKGKDAKTLLKKIDKHRDSTSHRKCEEILAEKESERLLKAVKNAEIKFVERHKDNIAATVKVFRTAYECAKSHLPCTEHTRLIQLQLLNGVDCGNVLYSNHSCGNIIHHVSDQMRSELVQHIVSSHAKLSILVDESTSVSNIQSMVVYLRTQFDGEICTYFLGLLELTDATAAGLEMVLHDFLNRIGLDDNILREQFIGFCSDGASCMIGEHKGMVTLLKAKFPLLQTFHCMAHRLELAVKNSVDTVNAVSHFKIYVDELYKVYSMSPKNQRELDAIANSLSIELLKIQKVFDVRWVFSSFVAVKAILRDYSALFAHFTNCASETSGRTSKERSRYRGLLSKMQSWFFVSEICMLKDALRCLTQLSLYLQSHEANVLNAHSHIVDTINKLQALKKIKLCGTVNIDASDGDEDDDHDDDNDDQDECDAEVGLQTTEAVTGEHRIKLQGNVTTLGKFLASFENDQHYKGVKIVKKDVDAVNFAKLKSQFMQSLCDNLQQRFPSTDLLEAASCLSNSTWPTNPLERALYGEKYVATLCKKFGVGSTDAAETVLEYSIFKMSDGLTLGPKLKYFISMLKVLPISSADCERGFSQMNLYHTSGRNRLLVTSVNDMLMIGINGPPITSWNAEKYVITWLKSGRHGALDKPTGLPTKPQNVTHSSKLFA